MEGESVFANDEIWLALSDGDGSISLVEANFKHKNITFKRSVIITLEKREALFTATINVGTCFFAFVHSLVKHLSIGTLLNKQQKWKMFFN